jgi:hypothetical protein
MDELESVINEEVTVSSDKIDFLDTGEQKAVDIEKQRREDIIENSTIVDKTIKTFGNKFSPVFQSATNVKNTFEESFEWVDEDFQKNKGYDEILKYEKYNSIPQDLKDKALSESSHNEFIFQRRLDQYKELEEQNVIFNEMGTIPKIAGAIGSTVVDPLNILVAVKGISAGNRIFKINENSTKLNKFAAPALTQGLADASLEYAISSNDKFVSEEEAEINSVIAGISGGLISGGFNLYDLQNPVTLDNIVDSQSLRTQKELQGIDSSETINLKKTKTTDLQETKEKGKDISIYGNFKPIYSNKVLPYFNSTYSKIQKSFSKGLNVTSDELAVVNYFTKSPIGISADKKSVQHKTVDENLHFTNNRDESKMGISYNKVKEDIKQNKELSNYIKENHSEGYLDSGVIPYLAFKLREIEAGVKNIDIPKEIQPFINDYRSRGLEKIDGYGKNGYNVSGVDRGSVHVSKKFSDSKLRNNIKIYGSKQIKKVFTDSFVSKWSEGKELSKKQLEEMTGKANNISKVYLDRLLTRFQEKGTTQGKIGRLEKDIDKITEDLIKEGKLSEKDKTLFLDVIQDNSTKVPGFLNNRIKSNDFLEVPVKNLKTGSMDTVRIVDMLENDILEMERGFHRNTNADLNMIENGTVKVDGKRYDMNTAEDRKKFLDKLENKDVDTTVLKQHFEDLIHGGIQETVYGQSGIFNSVARSLRNTAVGSLLGQTWLMQIPEATGVVVTTGIKNTIEGIPEVFSFYNKVTKNIPLSKGEKIMWEDLGSILGKEKFRSKSYMRMEDDVFGNISDQKFLKALEKHTGNFSQFTLTRVGFINEMTAFPRMLMGFGEVKDWVKRAHSGEKLNDTRRAELGLTEEMENNLYKMLKETVDKNVTDVNKIFDTIGKSKHYGGEEYESMILAIQRKSEQMVLDVTLGEASSILQRDPLIKLGFQFLSFVINAYEKILLKQTGHYDKEALAMLSGSIAGAYISQLGKTVSTSLGDEEKMKKRLEIDKQLISSLMNTPHFGVPGMLASNFLGMTDYGKDLGFRSGSPSGTFTGAPGIQNAERISRFMVKLLDPDKEVQAKDFKAIGVNFFGQGSILNNIDK